MDVLSDVLRAVRMTGALYFDLHCRAPWVAETPPAEVIREAVMPGFERIIVFHFVLEGTECWSGSPEHGYPPVCLHSGDVILCTDGVGHFMGSGDNMRAQPIPDLYYNPRDAQLPFVYSEIGGNGKATHLACGYFGCDARPFNPILESLPGMIHLCCEGAEGDLLRQSFAIALAESRTPRPGGEALLATLSELMLLNVVRRYIDRLQPEATGWLAGLRDRHVCAALRLMHGYPARSWTLEALAGEVGMSRSAFAEHFTRLVETPPMQYLSNWRLQLASGLLDRPGISIEEVADRVGYESVAAFNRAFKRQVGLPPGAWRRRRRAPGAHARAMV